MPRLCPTCSKQFKNTAELMLHRRTVDCFPELDDPATIPLLSSHEYGSYYTRLPTGPPDHYQETYPISNHLSLSDIFPDVTPIPTIPTKTPNINVFAEFIFGYII